MTTKEAKATIKKWLKEKEFKLTKITGFGSNTYIYPMGEYNILVFFYKDRFSDAYIFEVGCYFDDCEYGDALIRVLDLPSNSHKSKDGHSQGLYYGEGELSENQLLQCLDEMFDKYLKPYYEQGKKYLKYIILNEYTLFGEGYSFSKGAREKINKMFGLNTKFKIYRD